MIFCCFRPLSCVPFFSYVLLFLFLSLGILSIDYGKGQNTRYAALFKNCGWSHHKDPLIATTSNAMCLYSKAADGNTTTVLSWLLLQMVCSSIEKL